MSIIFGSARVDEKGGYVGGVAGDQTGKEVSTQPYYMHRHGWYCLRPKSPSDAIKIANSMKSACANDNIGYDQGNRFGIITAIQKYGSMKKIATKTEADCSTLVRACCMEAKIYPDNFTTYNEASILDKTGKFEKKFEVTSEKQLRKGDILVSKKKGHTVVVVSGPDPKKASTSTATKTETESYKVGDKIKVDGIACGDAKGNHGCIDLKNRTMYITEILDKKKYSYYIAVSQSKGGIRFGWIKPTSIKK